MQVPNKKILPTLLLVLQCLFQVLRGQYFNRSNKIKLAAYLFLAVLNQLVILSMRNFSKHLIERKKGFGRYSVLSSVLLTKFGLSVSSVWSPGLIEKLTIMKWPCDFQKVGTGSQVATFLTLFWIGKGAWIRKLWSGTVLLINKFYIKKYILCWLNKIMLGNPCTNF